MLRKHLLMDHPQSESLSQEKKTSRRSRLYG